MIRVLSHGVFDLLNLGHIEHLKEARSFGDWLTVSVVPDAFVTKRKVIFDERTRMAMLHALRCVDDVLLCGAPGPEMIISLTRPNLYVRGHDYAGKLMPESALLERLGIPTRTTSVVLPHSADIIRTIVTTYYQGQDD